MELVLYFKNLCDLLYSRFDLGCGHFVVFEGKCEILVYGHGVIDHRELEYLCNVSVPW